MQYVHYIADQDLRNTRTPKLVSRRYLLPNSIVGVHKIPTYTHCVLAIRETMNPTYFSFDIANQETKYNTYSSCVPHMRPYVPQRTTA